MAVKLTKGGNVNLSKEAPGLTAVIVGLGWSPRATDGAQFDLDGSAFLLKADKKVRTDKDFIFYNELKSVDGSVEHGGDNRTGQGEGDDEKITIDLSKVPAEIQTIAITVTIDEADTRRQNFGQVSDAFIRVVNKATGTEIARFDLTEEASSNTAMIFGELYRAGTEWKFRAVQQGFNDGLAGLCRMYGVAV